MALSANPPKTLHMQGQRIFMPLSTRPPKTLHMQGQTILKAQLRKAYRGEKNPQIPLGK